MQAFHHHHPNMPNGLPASNLLTTSSQMNNNIIHQSPNLAAVSSYQDLVRNCLPQLNNCNGNVASSTMVSFAVRLMSLNQHELRCLNGDPDLVRYINQVHMLIENKLQDLHAKSASALHSQQHQHLLSPLNYYTNYYNQQLTLNQLHEKQTHQQQLPHQQHQQQQQQQQHLLLMGQLNCINNAANSQDDHELSAIHSLNHKVNPVLIQQQQQQQQHHHHQQHQHQNQQNNAPALDLRTTPRPMSALSATPSPIGSRAGSTGSAGNSRQSAPSLQHPKKVKLSEYRKMQQLAERGSVSGQTHNQQQQQQQQQHQHHQMDSVDENSDANPSIKDEGLSPSSKRLQPDGCGSGDMTLATTTSTRSTQKKYKGEFDEPNLEEVTERQQLLDVPGHYHCKALECGECACVIGSEFRDKSKREALELLDRWRSLEVEERIKWKWDLNDLPKDIPLSDIKKFEDLRRDYSSGRADFGGASKRKPLGIRGTRQFLLMLYCLWGHPGRDDAMQREGYCPHCFAKIRTNNEQSTLVRVVNHFNMKHRKGANPRLSPHMDRYRQSPQLLSPHNHQVHETLISMVESAAAAAAASTTEEEALKQADDDVSSTLDVDRKQQVDGQEEGEGEEGEGEEEEKEEGKEKEEMSCTNKGQESLES